MHECKVIHGYGCNDGIGTSTIGKLARIPFGIFNNYNVLSIEYVKVVKSLCHYLLGAVSA